MNGGRILSGEDDSTDTPTPESPVPSDLLDLLGDLPDDKRTELIRFFSQIEVYRHFSGPLPPPDVLNLYDAETRKVIVDDAVARRKHRTKTESRSQIILFVIDILALFAGFILALLVVVGSMDALRAGQSIEGLVGIGGTVSVIAGAFLYRDHRNRITREADQVSQLGPDLPDSGGSDPS